MQIEQVALSTLKPYPGNARTHSRKQIRKLAAAMKQFGVCAPILVSDNLTILAGHGRVEAAKQLGHQTVPVVRLAHLTEEQRRAYVLADNRLAEDAVWENDTLALELKGLADAGFDLTLTGFEIPEVDIIVGRADEAHGADAEDVVPEPTRIAVSRPGDLWTLGTHRLICGDAQAPDVYEALMDGEKAQAIFCDPPFNVRIPGHVGGRGVIRHPDFAMASGELDEAAFVGFLTRVCTHLAAHSSNGSLHYIFMDWRHAYELLRAGRSVYAKLVNICVWNKSNGGMGSFYRSKHELVFVWQNGTQSHINNVELGRYGRSRSNVWDYPGANSFKSGRLDELALHPTVKPVALVADALKDCTSRNGLVLDSFAGSGTTILAAESIGRRARAIELDPVYVDVAIRRWQKSTGKTAVLQASGESFELVQETRGVEQRA